MTCSNFAKYFRYLYLNQLCVTLLLKRISPAKKLRQGNNYEWHIFINLHSNESQIYFPLPKLLYLTCINYCNDVTYVNYCNHVNSDNLTLRKEFFINQTISNLYKQGFPSLCRRFTSSDHHRFSIESDECHFYYYCNFSFLFCLTIFCYLQIYREHFCERASDNKDTINNNLAE